MLSAFKRSIKSKYFFSLSLKERIKKEKVDRLKEESSYFPTQTIEDSDKIRNIGIIAHIDAGKTTATERMLYYSGALPFPGEVHDGTTVMDYMPQERQRGITIRSAAISFNWKQFQFNLIDTPGHIDFTAEVERSLRVLDGAVAIFDGVSGVQTQSETVWFQANRFNIPRLAFINKMDRQGANLDYTISSMKERLNIQPLVQKSHLSIIFFSLQYPLGESDTFTGVIDLLELKQYIWTDQMGTQIEISPIDKDHSKYQKVIQYRDQLFETIASFDDGFAENYIDDKLSLKYTRDTIRKLLHSNPLKFCPVLIGSALKNKGIQPLMDAIINYLPIPSERPPVVDYQNPLLKRGLIKNEKFLGYIYKVIHDPKLGSLAYTRIYSGELAARSTILNSTMNQIEKIGHIYRVRANRYVSINFASAGDIVAIANLKNPLSGTTLISQGDPNFILSQLEMPQCVIFAELEYESLKDKQKLDQALAILQKEDTSLKITQDDSGQILIGGLGELHLEIVVQRLKEDWNLKTKIKQMQVEYKEGVTESYCSEEKFSESLNNRPLWFQIKLKAEPIQSQSNEVLFDFPRETSFDVAYNQFKTQISSAGKKEGEVVKDQNKYMKNPCKQIECETIVDEYGEEKVYTLQSMPFQLILELEQSIIQALERGSLLSLPIRGVRVSVLNGKYTFRRTTQMAIGRSITKLMKEIILECKPIILEPVMKLEISCPNNCAQMILNDLVAQRRGKLDELKEDQNRFGKAQNERSLILGSIPLQETLGYSSYLRSISQGEAHFTMNFLGYEYVGVEKQKELILQ